jgi:hypothetical protein
LHIKGSNSHQHVKGGHNARGKLDYDPFNVNLTIKNERHYTDIINANKRCDMNLLPLEKMPCEGHLRRVIQANSMTMGSEISNSKSVKDVGKGKPIADHFSHVLNQANETNGRSLQVTADDFSLNQDRSNRRRELFPNDNKMPWIEFDKHDKDNLSMYERAMMLYLYSQKIFKSVVDEKERFMKKIDIKPGWIQEIGKGPLEYNDYVYAICYDVLSVIII